MSSRRTLILIVAVAIGAVAAFALFNYIGGIEDRANENAERVDVLVISADVPKGTPAEQAISAGRVSLDKIPREFRPATAVVDTEQLSNLVAITDLSAGQVLVQGMFVTQAEAQTSFSQRLEEDGLVAISLSIDGVRSVGGLLVPGDTVNILTNVAVDCEFTEEEAEEIVEDLAEGFEDAEPPQGVIAGSEEDTEAARLARLCQESPYSFRSRYLFQGAEILAIGHSVAPEPGEIASATASGVLTFAVSPESAQRIAAIDPSTIYLTLVPETLEPYPIPPLDIFETLPGEEEGRLTPINTADSFDPNKVAEGEQ
ncbi:MAG: Flp pilus assembly protein CpaB [Actinomycetia bacterium]|nr:Flp pilus assembly protein CpaB [Actinomycetes bacterium]